MRLANMSFAVVLLGVAVTMIWIAVGFDSAASVGSTMLDSNVFPIAMMGVTAAGCVLLILRTPRDTMAGPLFSNGGALLRVIGLAVLLMGAYHAWVPLGFHVMSALFGVICAVILRARSWWVYAIAAVFGPIAGFVFEAGLGVQL